METTDKNNETMLEENKEALPEQNSETLTEESDKVSSEENTEASPEENKVKPTKKQQFIQLLKFTGFSISAGVIQFVATGLLSTWTGLMPEGSSYYWIAYLTGLILSVIWNFTFNRKFTFKAANNVPLAMGLVVVYYCMFAPLSTFGANAIVRAWKNAAGDGWDQNYEMVITAAMMLINFATEFLWDKFIVFNAKVTDINFITLQKEERQKRLSSYHLLLTYKNAPTIGAFFRGGEVTI